MYRNLCIGGAACDLRSKPAGQTGGLFRLSLPRCIGETIAQEETVYHALSWVAMPTVL
jgi:hypothetical protein